MPAAEPWAERFRRSVERGRYWARDYLYVARRQLRAPWEHRVPEAFASGDKAPVVLMAGVIEPWTMLLPVAERLHAAGHPIHVVPELAFNVLPIGEAADVVQQAISARDLRHVVLVAHSKGGLVGKRLLLDDVEGRIDRLIAIATPFHGSRMARLLPGPTIAALRPDDPVIVGLGAQAVVNAKITSIYPSFDPHVPEGSELDGAVNIQVPAMGHFRVLKDPEVLDAVVAAAS